jgi:hypothetical protein
MYKCQFCNSERISKKSLIAHESTCPKNPAGYRNIAWNKGQTKKDNQILKNLSERMTGKKRPDISLKLKGKPSSNPSGMAATPEKEKIRREKLSAHAKLIKLGGYKHGSGRGKKGWYKGYFCDSSWELAYVIYCLDHNKSITRNLERRTYTWNNKQKIYIPDFIVDGQLIEIKGYKTKEWEAKLENNKDVKVLYENDLKDIFNYVIKKYGKKYIELYEGEMAESGLLR